MESRRLDKLKVWLFKLLIVENGTRTSTDMATKSKSTPTPHPPTQKCSTTPSNTYLTTAKSTWNRSWKRAPTPIWQKSRKEQITYSSTKATDLGKKKKSPSINEYIREIPIKQSIRSITCGVRWNQIVQMWTGGSKLITAKAEDMLNTIMNL